MEFNFVPLTIEMVNEISSWRYSGYMKDIYTQPYYDNYDLETQTTKGPGGCHGFGVYDDNRLMGLFEYYFYDGVLELGLALAPDYIGKGYSKAFILAGITFGVKTYEYKLPYVQLHVDIDNESARIAYKKAGFTEVSIDNNEILMKYYL
jgi:ribosomal-protein-alanine N-acetyltransferase